MVGKVANNEIKSNKIIKIRNLSKRYARKPILTDINLEIHQGDSIAFIGHNGCGKSTLIKIIAGLLPFNDGNVSYMKKLKFAYVPERFPDMNISALNYVKQIGRIAGLSSQEAEKRSMQLFESLFMQDMVKTPIRYLSKGTIQKVAVVQAFLFPTDVLLLDEPISGQDIASQRIFINMVNRLNDEYGVTILCSCHEDYMISSIAHSVYEIIDGKLHKAECETRKVGSEKIYRLHFIRGYGCEIKNFEDTSDYLSRKVQEIAIKIEWLDNKSKVIIYVTALNSDVIIKEMISANFMLKGINDEVIL